MIQDILLGIPWGILLSFMIGPVFFILIETSIVKGFRAALCFDLGVVSADVIFIALAYIGSYRLLNSLTDKPALFIFGGILMSAYSIISFISLFNSNKQNESNVITDFSKANYIGLYFKGFFLNLINIGVLGFWLTVILSTGPKLDMDQNRMFSFFISVLSTYLLIDCLKILLAKQLKSKLTIDNIYKIKQTINIVLLIFGIVLITQGFFPTEKKLVQNALHSIESKK